MSLEGQKVVVVGGSSGMGLAAAKALVEAGARVVIAARSQEKLDSAREHIPGELETYSLDFTNEEAVKEFFARFDKIDHLVIAASGTQAWGPFEKLESFELRKAFDGKFWGHFYCSKHALPHLRKDSSIIFFAGAASRTVLPGAAGVAAVNAAITAMAFTIAKELAPLRVNVISPGPVDTPAYDWMTAEEKDEFFKQMAVRLPVKRIGRADEVAEAVLFLLNNNYVTGVVLDIDGGVRLG
jgi:NAD(P)-dependent dehydrogenase (short-subunit alcohol dehydrogenase family)